MNWSKAISEKFSRTVSDTADARSGKGKVLGVALIGAAVCLWSALFLSHFVEELGAWNRIVAVEAIERSKWSAADAGAYETTIDSAALRRVEAAGTTVLYLGEFFAPYKVFIDGVPAARGLRNDLVFVNLDAERLRRGSDLRIRVEVKPFPDGSLSADFLGRGAANTVREGFLSPLDESRVRLMLNIYRRVRPAAFTLAYFVITAFFFLLWQATPLRLDYFGMAMFSLSCTFYQAGRTDFLSGILTHQTWVWLGVLTKGSFAITGLALGIAFARWRPLIFWGVLLGGLTACAIGGLIAPHLAHTRGIEDFIEKWLVPGAFVLGASACFIESLVLRGHDKGENVRAGFRATSLVVFGGTMFALGSYHFFVRHYILVASPLVWLLMGTETFALILVLSILALRDYRTQQKLLARIPISPFHQRDPLPLVIAGALLMVDIKNSEALFRLGAAEGSGGMLVDRCLSHLWSAVVRSGGVVLRTDGDGLAALFSFEQCQDPMASALAATDSMRAELAILADQLADEGYLEPDDARLDFRGSITVGQIRPIWLEIGGTREAAWTETGNQNTFVEGARLLELERALRSESWPEQAAPGSAVLVQERDTQLAGARDWKKRCLRLTGKHGAQYEVAVYVPSSQPMTGHLKPQLDRAA